MEIGTCFGPSTRCLLRRSRLPSVASQPNPLPIHRSHRFGTYDPVIEANRPAKRFPGTCGQHYRAYAKEQLIEASQGHPYAAELLYALGKTYDKEADKSTDNAFMLRNQAVVCYQAALGVTPRHADGANQLGYALLKLDRVDEAYYAIASSIQTRPAPEAWDNLAEVYRRKGDVQSQNYALNQSKILSEQNVSPDARGLPEVVQLDPRTFASISPSNYALPNAPIGRMAANSAPAQSVQQASAAEPKSKPTSWFGRMFSK